MATSGDLSDDASPPVFAPQAVSSVAPSVPTFSQEQYNQILALLQKAPSELAVNAAGTLNWKDEGDW
ncbi:hypothetical protein HRI_003983800 [Hibiscus trionum]|nr:hypothetical protein HRI_003983800 [Hibiscus trionum]